MDRFLKKQAYIDERDLKFIKDKDRETLNLESDTLKGRIEFFIQRCDSTSLKCKAGRKDAKEQLKKLRTSKNTQNSEADD